MLDHTASHTWLQAVPYLSNRKIFNAFWYNARCEKERAKQTHHDKPGDFLLGLIPNCLGLVYGFSAAFSNFSLESSAVYLSYFAREPRGDKSDLNSGHWGMNITVHKWDPRPTAELLVEPSESHFHIDISNQVRPLRAEGTAA